MVLTLALLGVLVPLPTDTKNPPKPNFLALVRKEPKAPLTTPEAKAEWLPNVAEATTMAKYLDKAWDKLVDGTAADRLLARDPPA